jgi:hypothetical protein
MTKEVGIKASRPNKLGLPDLIKPTMETHGYDWEAPTHEDNTGLFKALFEQPQTEEVQVEAVPEATTEEGEAAPKRKTRSKKV